MMLTSYGLREWLTITVIAAVIAAILASIGWWWGLLPVALLWLILVAFFRDPVRPVPQDLPPGAMLCPADGTITAVERLDHHDAVDGPAMLVRIFLSILDVHINRAPCDAQVRAIVHTPGQYLHAQSAEAARVNESNLLTLRLPDERGGETIGLRQVSGMIARRIVCRLSVGDRLQQGAKFGMIKFGSATELILPRPDDVVVHVREGQKVRAGRTLLATLDPVRSDSTAVDTKSTHEAPNGGSRGRATAHPRSA